MTIAVDLGRKATKQTNNHLSLKSSVSVGMLQVLKFVFLKFRILEILNSYPCISLETVINLHQHPY